MRAPHLGEFGAVFSASFGKEFKKLGPAGLNQFSQTNVNSFQPMVGPKRSVTVKATVIDWMNSRHDQKV